jgi:dTDP-4-dehydrorhamnose 3,5-epimerase
MHKPLKIKTKVFSDKRGKIFENFFYNKKINLCYSIISFSKKNVLRGFHFTLGGEYKILTIIKGKILDYCVDMKKKKIKVYKFLLNQGESLIIPKFFAHAYLCLSDENIIDYKMSKKYNINLKKNFRWNDPCLKINWRVRKPIISCEDKNALNYEICKKKYF